MAARFLNTNKSAIHVLNAKAENQNAQEKH
jgi:hypothetical protein